LSFALLDSARCSYRQSGCGVLVRKTVKPMIFLQVTRRGRFALRCMVMVHPDDQYTPRLATAMASMIAFDVYDLVLDSRILGSGALRGGMSFYK
jgi:hypothetical protein